MQKTPNIICGRFEGIDQRVIDHYGSLIFVWSKKKNYIILSLDPTLVFFFVKAHDL